MSLPAAIFALCLLAALVLMINVGPALRFSFLGGNLTYAFAGIRIVNGSWDPSQVCIYKNATVVWLNTGPGEHAICVGGDM